MRLKILLSILLIFIASHSFARKVTLTLDGSGNINHVTDAQSFYGIANDGSDTVIIPLVTGGYCGLGGIIALAGHKITVNVAQRITLYQLDLGVLVNVDLDLYDPPPGISKWGCFVENGTRAVTNNGYKLQHVLIANIEIYNCSDYGGYYYNSSTDNGSQDSMSHHVTWSNIYAHQTHGDAIHIQSGVWDSCTITQISANTMQSGDVLYLHDFHHMMVYNNNFYYCGYNDTRHVAQIDVAGGDGNIFLNTSDSCWGQQCRLNGVSLAVDKNSPMGNLNAFLNQFINNIKYGQGEVNNDNNNADTSSTRRRPTNYHFDYNTGGNIRDSDFHSTPYGSNGNGGCQFIFYNHYGGLTAIGNLAYNNHADYGQNLSLTTSYWIMNGNGYPFPTDTSYTIYSKTGAGYVTPSTGISINPGLAIRMGGPHLKYIDSALASVGIQIAPGRMNIGAKQQLFDINNHIRYRNRRIVNKP